jgi:hypothetical protein
MKIRSNVKAGGNDLNHNEKLASDINKIEQKKTVGKKLRLSKETIKELKDGELMRIGGGYYIQTAGCTREVICYLK